MSQPPDSQIPVIVAIGEVVDRPADPAAGREPVALMADALRAAQAESSDNLLAELDSVELVGQVSWRYRDPVRSVCERLGISPPHAVNASMGGETPIRLVHEAALRIARGEIRIAAVIGGEASGTLAKARKARVDLDWTPIVSREEAAKVGFDQLPIGRSSRHAGVTAPVHIYPLYENALQAKRGLTPAEGRRESATLWARYAAVAARNENAWIRTAPSADEIATPSEKNRMVCFPYTKLMVANPQVNQAAAVVVASLEWARAAGIPEDRLVHIWGGSAAHEPGDYLMRDGYDHSPAQRAVIEKAVELAGGDAGRFDLAELYSCFPVVPKLALSTLGLREGVEPTVAGGLTFFGGPLNNYMSHAVCAMVRKLRAHEGELGLLYSQGGVVSKHHALIVSSSPAPAPLAATYSVQDRADASREEVPSLVEDYAGPAKIETYTVIYLPNGDIRNGAVVARTPDGQRLLAQVRREDESTLASLIAMDRSPVGTEGHVRIDGFGKMVWEAGPLRDRKAVPKRFCSVERDGRLTIVTINRPEAMNALNPTANEELGEIFDDFQADPDQWVAILTGAGSQAFCAGNDLKFTAEATARGEGVAVPKTGWGGLSTRWDLTKPVIAAVNGLAMGGGFEVALACDLIVASSDAVFSLPEVKVGLAAVGGGLVRLPRQIPLKLAMEMILTGKRVSADEGKTLGFVNAVVPPAELMAAARQMAEAILAVSPLAVRASKEVVARGLEEPDLQTAYRNQVRYPAIQTLFGSQDVREGPKAFAEKRPPRWKGR